MNGCDSDTELLPVAQKEQQRITSEKISYDELISQLKNDQVKESVKSLKMNYRTETNRAEPDTLSFIKIDKPNEYTTYLLELNSYTTEEPYFLKYIITQSDREEKVGYVKYIPDFEIPYVDSYDFTGTIQMFDATFTLRSENYFIGSIEKDTHASNTTSRGVDGCTSSTRIIAHNCTNGGQHPPGTSCGDGYTNDGYYEIKITILCPDDGSGYDNSQLPNQFVDIGGGGGGGITPNPAPTNPDNIFSPTAFKLVSQLSPDQKEWWNTVATSEMKSDIIDYLNENSTILMNGTINPEALEFVKELMDYLITNPTMTWNTLMNNRTSFDINQGENIDDFYEEGNYDTTDYYPFNPFQVWSVIPPVIPQNEFVGWNRSAHKDWQCMDYAKEQLRVMGYQISSYYSSGQTFQIYTAQNGVNNTALSQGLSYLKYALSNNIPVIVGVDDAPGHPGNLDETTDHFIVIVGMGMDTNGYYFRFYDNASGETSLGTSSLNKLYYNSATGLIIGTSQTPYAQNQPYPYTITMIRKSKTL